jgi:pentatricopeptide repeat protein
MNTWNGKLYLERLRKSFQLWKSNHMTDQEEDLWYGSSYLISNSNPKLHYKLTQEIVQQAWDQYKYIRENCNLLEKSDYQQLRQMLLKMNHTKWAKYTLTVLKDQELIEMKYTLVDWRDMMLAYYQLEDYHQVLNIFESILIDTRKPHISIWNLALSAYIRQQELRKAEAFVKRMKSHGILPDVQTLNRLLHGYSQVRNIKMVKEIFDMIHKLNLLPTAYSYATLIDAYVKVGDLKNAEKVFQEYLRKHAQLNPVPFGALLQGYISQSKSRDADRLWKLMKQYKIAPTLILYNIRLHGFIKSGQFERAEALFREMYASRHVSPDDLTLLEMVRSFIVRGKRLEAIHFLFKSNHTLDTSEHLALNYLFVSIIDSGDKRALEELYIAIRTFNIPMNTTLLNILFSRLYTKLDSVKTRELLDEYQRLGLEPNMVTFSMMITKLTHSGDTKTAVELIEELRKRKFKLNQQTFAVMLYALYRHKDITGAYALLEEMREARIHLHWKTRMTAIKVAIAAKDSELCMRLYREHQHEAIFPHASLVEMALVGFIKLGCFKMAQHIWERLAEQKHAIADHLLIRLYYGFQKHKAYDFLDTLIKRIQDDRYFVGPTCRSFIQEKYKLFKKNI